MKDRIRRRKIFTRILIASSVSAIAAAFGCSFALAYGIRLPFIPRYVPEISFGLIVTSLIVIGCSYMPSRGEKRGNGKNSGQP